MKTFKNLLNKSGKGQVLVIVGLTMVMLVSVIGLSIDMGYMYASYARLRRAVDAAALAGSGEFKRNYTKDRLQGAALQALSVNLAGEKTIPGSLTFPVILIETCDTMAEQYGKDVKKEEDLLWLIDKDHADNPGREVCTKPLKKIVRATVRQNVQTFFVAIAGIQSFPIQAISLSEAATVDVLLTIDASESMTKGWPGATRNGDDADPSQCNIYNSCLPFLDVKKAAEKFLENLYFPYDRAGIVSFDKDATLILPLSDDLDEVKAAINGLKVFEAKQACPYRFQERVGDRSTFPSIAGDVVNPCRLYHDGVSGLGYQPNGYVNFDCPAFYGPTPDSSACPTTNTSDGVALAGAILTGDYSSVPPSDYAEPAAGWPEKRADSLWVLLLLTDGAANSGHDANGSRICPNSENSYAWVLAHPLCRDADTLERHCWNATDADCMGASFPTGTTSTANRALYDGDDRARDMFDVVSRNSTLTFTIGMGAETIKNDSRTDINGNSPGVTLLQYGAYGTTYAMTPYSDALKGLYYYGNNAADLTRIFLKIANNLATRINQ